jgi:hypothetical protein
MFFHITFHDFDSSGVDWLTIDLPISFALVADLQQTVLGIVPLFAIGALQVAAPCCSLVVVVFGNCEGSPATAGDNEHL